MLVEIRGDGGCEGVYMVVDGCNKEKSEVRVGFWDENSF